MKPTILGGAITTPAELPDLEKTFRERDRERSAFTDDIWIARKEAKSRYNSSYVARRLLTFYDFSLKRGESPENTKAICERFQRKQRENVSQAQKLFTYIVASHRAFATPEQWQTASEYDLSESELGAISGYVANSYEEVNQALLGNNKSKYQAEIKTFAAFLNSALGKIPPYVATPVVRFTNLPPKVLAEHNVGATITYKAFSSTSKNPNWEWKGAHRFLIFGGKNGKDISIVNPKEQEVLFTAGTRFKVLAREPNPDRENGIDFVLAEVDEKGEITSSGVRDLSINPY